MLTVIDGPLSILPCSNGLGHTCKQFSHCTIRDPLAEIEMRVKALLQEITLEDVSGSGAAPPPPTGRRSRTFRAAGSPPACPSDNTSMVSLPIYLDNNATTRTDPRVVEAMLPYFAEVYGNAASRGHAFGWAAEEAVAQARAQVAALIGADPREIVWTSGATESDNLALKGVMERYADKGDHLVTVTTEHKAVLDAAKHLEATGRRVTYLGVDRQGRIDMNALQDALTDRTVLVSVMMGSNEIGTLQPIAEIGALCRARGILFHTDATQCVGKMPVNVQDLPIDLMSFTAHKMHGPKGVGALYVRRRAPRVRLTAQMDGGGHEQGMRSGTLNVPGIVGFGRRRKFVKTNWRRSRRT